MFAYAFAAPPLSLIGLAYVMAILYVGGLLSLTLIGLPLLAVGLKGARLLGRAHARLIQMALGEPIETTQPGPPASGPLRWIQNSLSDVTAWRGMLYLALRFPIDAITFVVAIAVPGLGVWSVVWALVLQSNPWSGAGVVLGGLVVLSLVPIAVRALMALHLLLARMLLGPSTSQKRLRTLEQARGTVLAEGARELRRIERDLHDGTQAQLVALAMTLSLADTALDRCGLSTADRPRSLVVRARRQTDGVMAELRRLIDGISPAALDQGLESALPPLAMQAAVPVELTVDIAERPDEVIERVAYFCVAELLTNISKHSGATKASVNVRVSGRLLRIRVHDNGSGGARIGAGSGLKGLCERLSAVDGTLSLDSPATGTTTAEIELPVHI
ncbi:sensor histidine kinase [Spongiactinospora rosea]|uniref:histidine kinase n=2 Tax=Spongiactinospora rosea TaxID=2248750 RepID=A0A366LQP8_9ACTN|nr:sensor histidine kinase [Spongiactinospora rosea]